MELTNEDDEMVEGKLNLKRDSGGWRHYIEMVGGERDIYCGSRMEVQLGRYEYEYQDYGPEHFTRGEWLSGRYEARLTEPVTAYLVIGDLYPSSYTVKVEIPLGTVVRVRR